VHPLDVRSAGLGGRVQHRARRVGEHRRIEVRADRGERPHPLRVVEGEQQPDDRAVAVTDDVRRA